MKITVETKTKVDFNVPDAATLWQKQLKTEIEHVTTQLQNTSGEIKFRHQVRGKDYYNIFKQIFESTGVWEVKLYRTDHENSSDDYWYCLVYIKK